MAAERKVEAIAIGMNPETLAHSLVWLPTLLSTHFIRVASLGLVVLVFWCWSCGLGFVALVLIKFRFFTLLVLAKPLACYEG